MTVSIQSVLLVNAMTDVVMMTTNINDIRKQYWKQWWWWYCGNINDDIVTIVMCEILTIIWQCIINDIK